MLGSLGLGAGSTSAHSGSGKLSVCHVRKGSHTNGEGMALRIHLASPLHVVVEYSGSELSLLREVVLFELRLECVEVVTQSDRQRRCKHYEQDRFHFECESTIGETGEETTWHDLFRKSDWLHHCDNMMG